MPKFSIQVTREYFKIAYVTVEASDLDDADVKRFAPETQDAIEEALAATSLCKDDNDDDYTIVPAERPNVD